MEIVRRLIEASDRSDYSAALDSIGPDIEVNVAYQADFGGTSLGVRFYGRGKSSGVEIDAPAWHAWRLRGGKAVRWQLFRTKQEAHKAAGLSD